MKKVKEKNKLVIYQAKNGAIEFKGDFSRETIWATQAQIAELFNIQRPAITKHLKNIFESKELEEKAVCSILEHTADDGKKYKTQFYNLDAIISVGYRVNSKTATEFRKWATKTIKDHLVKGYTIKRKTISKNYTEFIKDVDNIKNLLPKNLESSQNVLELIKAFADTWLSLDSYDKDEVKIIKASKEKISLASEELENALLDLKKELIKKGEATELFGKDRNTKSLEGIVGNVMQTFAKKMLYKSIEEKAVHLLYFIVKDHPFVDGNKRSAAFSFIWFLNKYKKLNKQKISAETLTVLTLLVAESNPKDKERIINLILRLIA
jgi:prophage maintenance system killer protein